MNLSKLVEIPFFEDLPQVAEYKVYNDGGHYIATMVSHKENNKQRTSSKDEYFDNIYEDACLQELKGKALIQYILAEYSKDFEVTEKLKLYVEEKVKAKKHNLYNRIKRFRRKVHLNTWNNFVTITYDDKLHTPASFKSKLKKCLSNLHTRRGWKYAGVFEKAPKTGRLHFHCLMYIPENEMVGQIEEVQDYSTAQHKMQITHSNSFFAKTFGRNDFVQISQQDIKNGNVAEYLIKYIAKTNEKLIYSRGIPTELEISINRDDIVVPFVDYITIKYILFNDAIIRNNLQYTKLRI